MLERSSRVRRLIWRLVGGVKDAKPSQGDGRVLGLVRHMGDLGDLSQRYRRSVRLVITLGF